MPPSTISDAQYEAPAGFAAIADLVGNGLGTAFLPVSEARRCSNLRSVELVERVLWQGYLASPAVDHLMPATARLADALLDAPADIRAR